jgi:hypothetical protein
VVHFFTTPRKGLVLTFLIDLFPSGIPGTPHRKDPGLSFGVDLVEIVLPGNQKFEGAVQPDVTVLEYLLQPPRAENEASAIESVRMKGFSASIFET